MFNKKELYTDIWHYLKNTTKHIVLYGMGDGADKILSVCQMYDIKVDDFFASDEFVRGQFFHGKQVLSYTDICNKYNKENIIVLLSFASNLENVLNNIKKIASECELLAPDVPVYGNEIFNYDFYIKNQESIENAEKIFADDESRRVFQNIIKYKLSGKINYLFECESKEDESFALLGADKFESIADLGAYNGDTIRKIKSYSKNLTKVTAFEPDKKNYSKLLKYCESESIKIDAYNMGAWSKKESTLFNDSGNRNSSLECTISSLLKNSEKKVRRHDPVELDTLDNILRGEKVDYIKYDVEGSEREALIGSMTTITMHSPVLLVSAYHKSADIFELPIFISEIYPNCNIYLRKLRYIPAWDLNIIAVKK